MDDILLALRALPVEFKALILGVVEGLTEFLPVSSTGHLIIVGSFLGFDDERAKVFDIAIQTGAVSSILWLYRKRFAAALGPALRPHVWRAFFQSAQHRARLSAAERFLPNLFLAFLPAAFLGLLFGGFIKAQLFNPIWVAFALVLGGFIILWVERAQARAPEKIRIASVDDVGPMDALKIGFSQAFALIPGTSRSGATIIGGMLFGFSRQAATEFSFFLAVPTLFAAAAYSVARQWDALHVEDFGLFLIGTASSFVVALLVVRWLLRFVSTHSLNGFAYYRIGFGVLVLISWQFGWVDWSSAD
jgi:undecaprenyl-diphosphatase